jgi:hypothetical protein
MQHLHLSLIYHVYYFVHGLSCIYPRTYLLILLLFFLPFVAPFSYPCLIGLSFDDVWISQCDSIREWLSSARRPLTVQRYAKNLGPWFQFLDQHDLHQYIDLSPTGSDDFRRILI